MMNKILTAAALAFMAVACSTKVEEPLQYGELSIRLASAVDVMVDTKADDGADVSGYMVYISGDAGYAGYSSIYSDFEPQILPLGNYTVSAENMDAETAETGKGDKRIAGSVDVELSADDLTPEVVVQCSVVNSLVTVEFDFASVNPEQFEDLKVEVTGGDSGRTFTVHAGGEASGELQSVGNTELWFNPSTVSYRISGTFRQTGKVVDITGSKELAAKNHMKILISVNLENGQISNDLTINVDSTIDSNIQTEDAEFNPYN